MEKKNPFQFVCAQCGLLGLDKDQLRAMDKPGYSGGVGYAVTDDGRKICYKCCAINDAEAMADTGRAVLYLAPDHSRTHSVGCSELPMWKLTNWPGSFEIPVYCKPKAGGHNIAGVRYDIWFSWRGYEWHGVQYGDNTQLCHCRRLKKSA